MEARVMFLAGAPESDTLQWGDDSKLTPYFTTPVRRFLGDAVEQDSTTQVTQTPATHPLAKWRAVEVAGQQDKATHPSSSLPKKTSETARFLSFEDNPDFEHENFLEYSLAVLQDLESSQIEAPSTTFLDETTGLTSTSFDTALSSIHPESDSGPTAQPSQQMVSFNGSIEDLKRIPNARHLQSIHPQTKTVNILASVISVQRPRTVRVRRTGAEMDIVEVLMGDETRAGFNISFWLTPIDSQRPFQSFKKDSLRNKIDELRIGDVVLVKQLALSEWKGNVYGQSLSRRITRNNTDLVVLGKSVTGLDAPTKVKLDRVRKWSRDFVGKKRDDEEDDETTLLSSGVKRRKTQLPPDTQY